MKAIKTILFILIVMNAVPAAADVPKFLYNGVEYTQEEFIQKRDADAEAKERENIQRQERILKTLNEIKASLSRMEESIAHLKAK